MNRKKRSRLSSCGGFSLIELMIVIAIAAILANVLILHTGQALSRARDSRRMAEIDSIAKALQLYRLDHNNSQYPDNIPGGKGCWLQWTGGNVENGSSVQFLPELVTAGYFSKIPVETYNPNIVSFGNDLNWDSCSYRYMRVADFAVDEVPACTQFAGVGMAALYTVLENPGPSYAGRQYPCMAGVWTEGAPGNNDYVVMLPEN